MTNPSFVPFALEHYQSLHERNVELNVADSSVKCVTTREWLTESEIETLLDTGLFYPEVNGTTALRSATRASATSVTARGRRLAAIGSAWAKASAAT